VRVEKISGLVGASSSAVIAELAKEHQIVFVVTSSSAKAQILLQEIKLFSDKEVLLFPPSEDVGQRLLVISCLEKNEPLIVVASSRAIEAKTSKSIQAITLSSHQSINLSDFIEQLIGFGYKRFDIVGAKGEFSLRGGILDIFPLNLDKPVRLEFADDKIASMREFDPYSQRSINKIESFSLLPARENEETSVFEHLPKDSLLVFDEDVGTGLVPVQSERTATRAVPTCLKTMTLSSFLSPGDEPLFMLPDSYINNLEAIPENAIVVSRHVGLTRPFIEGSLRGGFVYGRTIVLSDKELFGEELRSVRAKAPAKEGVADELLADLKKGDFVVHENYGIARFQGMAELEIDEIKQEYVLLEFAEGSRVYVPPSQAGMVEKYSSAGSFIPKLSKLGTRKWELAKSRVKKALEDMTEELLELYAARAKLPGFAFPPDDLWQRELLATFPYDETPDQRRAIIETKRDMESQRPMDRLICGDVGYGKTEVAIRAAAKAASAGKQVAILVPTTILADQHYNNFKERFKASPFNVELLSRFRSRQEQLKVLKDLASGKVDIVIGTHRLLSKDVVFLDLGLLIIDEEQRFGVKHKEKLKKLKKNIDVLALSATPIPRTLYLSLSGGRDMSVILTSPVDRSPIKTYVLPFSETVIKEAILKELDRGGQVYFLHNKVETIDSMAAKIKRLAPAAKVGVGHGQMNEKELEVVMLKFLDKKYDVLVCTSIIESGLDITSVNTILIDEADHFGLSQLYQIRGRVGRGAVRAYAYLFYYPEKLMSDDALERLKAIQEFTALGSGYKLAMKDLEIRGAGNLLGREQSGHVLEVGFDLYCELLEEAVKKVKGITEKSPREIELDLKVEAFIPPFYVPDERQRLALYRRLNLLSTKAEVDEVKLELCDRFGQLPPPLLKLFELLYLKALALTKDVKRIKEVEGKIIVEKFNGQKQSLDIGNSKLDIIKIVKQYIGG